jgi:hypothetical protein
MSYAVEEENRLNQAAEGAHASRGRFRVFPPLLRARLPLCALTACGLLQRLFVQLRNSYEFCIFNFEFLIN